MTAHGLGWGRRLRPPFAETHGEAPSNTTRAPVSLIEQRKLEANAHQQPIARTVTDVQGKPPEDRFKDSLLFATVNKSYFGDPKPR